MVNQVLNSHAKINVGLRILGKRSDGYHDLETIFYPVKLHDKITISLSETGSDCNTVILRSNKSYLPLNRDNLCYRAVEKFFVEFAIAQHYHIEIDIEKNIPISGGLGGGSSNAASVIKFLTRQLNIDVQENKGKLIGLARDIGSDVPFFLVMKPCYAEGRGEIMRVLPEFSIGYDILIVNSSARVSTKWAFGKMRLDGKPPKEKKLDKVTSFTADSPDIFENDFESIAFRNHIELKDIKDDLLEQGAVFASMSGSGSSMYGFFGKKSNRIHAAARGFASKGYFTYISKAN